MFSAVVFLIRQRKDRVIRSDGRGVQVLDQVDAAEESRIQHAGHKEKKRGRNILPVENQRERERDKRREIGRRHRRLICCGARRGERGRSPELQRCSWWTGSTGCWRRLGCGRRRRRSSSSASTTPARPPSSTCSRTRSSFSTSDVRPLFPCQFQSPYVLST